MLKASYFTFQIDIFIQGYNQVRSDNRGRRDRGDDDDDEGGILGGLGDIVGKIFGG